MKNDEYEARIRQQHRNNYRKLSCDVCFLLQRLDEARTELADYREHIRRTVCGEIITRVEAEIAQPA